MTFNWQSTGIGFISAPCLCPLSTAAISSSPVYSVEVNILRDFSGTSSDGSWSPSFAEKRTYLLQFPLSGPTTQYPLSFGAGKISRKLTQVFYGQTALKWFLSLQPMSPVLWHSATKVQLNHKGVWESHLLGYPGKGNGMVNTQHCLWFLALVYLKARWWLCSYHVNRDPGFPAWHLMINYDAILGALPNIHNWIQVRSGTSPGLLLDAVQAELHCMSPAA